MTRDQQESEPSEAGSLAPPVHEVRGILQKWLQSPDSDQRGDADVVLKWINHETVQAPVRAVRAKERLAKASEDGTKTLVLLQADISSIKQAVIGEEKKPPFDSTTLVWLGSLMENPKFVGAFLLAITFVLQALGIGFTMGDTGAQNQVDVNQIVDAVMKAQQAASNNGGTDASPSGP